jgi:hypothetical protein
MITPQITHFHGHHPFTASPCGADSNTPLAPHLREMISTSLATAAFRARMRCTPFIRYRSFFHVIATLDHIVDHTVPGVEGGRL